MWLFDNYAVTTAAQIAGTVVGLQSGTFVEGQQNANGGEKTVALGG